MAIASQHRVAIAALLAFSALVSRAAADVAELQATLRQLHERFAGAANGWQPANPPTGTVLFVAADQYTPPAAEAPQVSDARRQYADALYQLARQAADAGQLSLAFQWVTEAVRENPNHAEGRRVLGYEQRDGRWLTAYGVKMFDAGKTWDTKRGWIAAKDSAGAAAERKVNPQVDAARHADIKNGWQVRTDHFLVTTNHSLAAGAEFAARLERLYQIWRQLFAGFYYSEKEVRGLFAGERNARVQTRPFRVFYHRNREEYLEALRRRQPRIAETLGVYFDNTREAHFYAEATVGEIRPPVATLYHEAVHQLFQESKPTAKRIGAMANFWVVEGVANYFETLCEHVDPQAGLYYTIGDASAGRLPAARERLRDGFYIPLAELVKLNQDDVQRHPEIAKLYSEATGLAAFLVDGENGRYREPLVRYLQAVYAGRDRAETLSELTEASYPDLDAQYRRFMERLP